MIAFGNIVIGYWLFVIGEKGRLWRRFQKGRCLATQSKIIHSSLSIINYKEAE